MYPFRNHAIDTCGAPKRSNWHRNIVKVVLKLAVHLRVVHRPEPLIFIPTSWDTRRLIKTNASIAEQLQESTGRPIQRNYLCVCILQDTKPASRPGGLLRQRKGICQCRLSMRPWERYPFRKVFFTICVSSRKSNNKVDTIIIAWK